MTELELKEILEKHNKWLNNRKGGEKANLSEANLSEADLRGADLRGADLRGVDLSEADLSGVDLSEADLSEADLSGADLRGADLSEADLSGANLSGVDLSEADLSEADLSGADLRGADLSEADLSGANLSEADLRGVDLSGADLRGVDIKITPLYNEGTCFYALQCPEEGSFIGFKKCREDRIVKLLITEDSLRYSATTRKCRASKVKVLEILSIDKKESFERAISKQDSDFEYIVGETIEINNFDKDRWNECSSGIHFFITRKEAEQY